MVPVWQLDENISYIPRDGRRWPENFCPFGRHPGWFVFFGQEMAAADAATEFMAKMVKFAFLHPENVPIKKGSA